MQRRPTFVYKVSAVDRASILAAVTLAIDNCLYVDEPDFSLKAHLHEWVEDLSSITDDEYSQRSGNLKALISFAFDPDSQPSKPIGLCLKTGNQFTFYVKPNYRRLNIGSALLQLMRGLYGDRKAVAFEGIQGSIEFFNKNRLSHNHACGKRLTIFEHFRAGKPAKD